MTIKELRKRTGLSQSKFAERFHLSMRTLQRWEQNQNEPQEAIVYMINRILDLEDQMEVKGLASSDTKRRRKKIHK